MLVKPLVAVVPNQAVWEWHAYSLYLLQRPPTPLVRQHHPIELRDQRQQLPPLGQEQLQQLALFACSSVCGLTAVVAA